jgi:mono/diheme cytochrome c family protein
MHLRIFIFAGAVLLSLTSVAAHSGARADAIAEGRKLAEKNCSRCHAIGLTGSSPHREAPPFRTIAVRGDVDNLQEALAEGIMVGHPDMPEFTFQPQEIEGFLAYLKTLAAPKK